MKRREAQRSTRVVHSLALVLALVAMLAGLFVSPQNAEGYTPEEFEIEAAADPTVEVDVSHSPTNPDPEQGDQFTYTMSFAFDRMVEQGLTRWTDVTVYADAAAPFDSVPSGGDWSGLNGGTVAVKDGATCDTRECTFRLTNLPNTVTPVFTKTATVQTDLLPGTPVMASARADVDGTLEIGLEMVESSAPSLQCTGTYTFKQRVTKGGGWLADIKFNDTAGQGKVMLAPGDRTIRAWNDPLADRDTIKVLDADGNDITAQVMENATYIANDPSVPIYLEELSGQGGLYRNAKWLDSLNWPYDPETRTGNTWLPAGSTIEVKRLVTYANCLDGGVSTDFTLSRPFGISTQIGRMGKVVSDSDADVFTTPGVAPPASCVDNMFVTSSTLKNTTGNDSSLYLWEPAERRTRTLLAKALPQTDALAATDRYPTKAFSLSRPGDLRVTETGESSFTTTVLNVPRPSTSYGPVWAANFAPDGSLYIITVNGRVLWLTESDISTLLAGGSATWKVGGTLQIEYKPLLITYTAPVTALDIAFDGSGNLYIAGRRYSEGATGAFREQYLAKMRVSDLPADGQTYIVQGRNNIGEMGGERMRAMAFLGDTLYLGMGTGALYTVNRDTLAITGVDERAVGYSVSLPSDFASCAFPTEEPYPPLTPQFKVQKSIINEDGSIAPAGTTGTKRTLNADGTLTIEYLVVVTNSGSKPGVFPTITDRVTVPEGFRVTGLYLDDVAQSSLSTFTIPGEMLGGDQPVFRAYTVKVEAVAGDLNAVNWSTAGTCNTEGAGTPAAGGFFNLVTMNDDSDGPNNNDACAPVSIAQLRLIKQIVDANGNLVNSTDSQYFDLRADGPTPLNGTSSTSGAIGPSGRVVPGSYSLSEQGNDDGATSGQYVRYAYWACRDVNTNAVVPVEEGAVSVADGAHVECVIKNTKKPKVHVVKTAADPTENPHIGQPVIPDENGTFTAEYRITVTNQSGATIDTGPVWDQFLVPDGLLWDGDKPATLSYQAPAGVTVTGSPTQVSRDALSTEATLAEAIRNLPHNGQVVFTLRIPLKIDTSAASTGTGTKFEEHAATLGVCEDETSAGGNPYTTGNSGIPNVTGIANEDLTYNDIPIEDNVACIPVQPVKFKIEKVADDPVEGNPHVGVTLRPDGNGKFIAHYQIKVTNLSTMTADSGAITDTFVVPEGLTWNDRVDGPAIFTQVEGSAGEVQFPFNGGYFGRRSLENGAEIASGVTGLAPGATAVIDVTIPLRLDLTVPEGQTQSAYERNADTLAECSMLTANPGGPHTDTNLGIPNVVALAGEDTGYSPIWKEDNIACVSVETPPSDVTLVKVNADGERLAGAEFTLYGPNDQNTVHSTVVVPASGEVTFTDLAGGKYWLKETKAPEGYAVDPTVYSFTVGRGAGISDISPSDGSLGLVEGRLEFTNLQPLELPMTGGPGTLPFALVGLALMAWAVLRTRARRRA
ncbi:SpaA isopeptide-forming pilin-related protein [Enemella sp. A6]|uniref:SpaA isopeptide-forming pilin-related protein n=1 Tax=Enemella sp. A6 TaxID=3440152 RepID=UPI003EBBB4A1